MIIDLSYLFYLTYRSSKKISNNEEITKISSEKKDDELSETSFTVIHSGEQSDDKSDYQIFSISEKSDEKRDKSISNKSELSTSIIPEIVNISSIKSISLN